MTELIFIAEEAPEGGYSARALGYSIFTEADTMEQLKEQIKDAVRCHYKEDNAHATAINEGRKSGYVKESVVMSTLKKQSQKE